MPPPSKEQVEVAIGVLRTEAGIWERNADVLDGLATKTQTLDFTRMEFGIFQMISGPHDEAIAQITQRCREGHDRMNDIAATLRKVAQTYEDEEARNLHRYRNLF